MEIFKFVNFALSNLKQIWFPANTEYFKFPDDNHTFALNWTSHPTSKDKRIVVFVPGFLTNHSNPYNSLFINKLKKRVTVCVIDYPLLCEEVTGDTLPNFLSEKYLRYTLNILKKRYPEHKLILFGLSLGGTLSIKCADMADKVIAVCSPVRIIDAWNQIKKKLYPMFQSLFLFGPLKQLVLKNPKKWSKNFIDVILTTDVDKLSTIIDELTGNTIYKFSIINELKNPVIPDITMVHTRNDSIVPFVPDSSGLFSRIKRVTYDKGDHLIFRSQQIYEIIDML